MILEDDPRFWTNLSYPYPACNFDLSNSGNRVTSAGICRFVTPSSILLKTTTSLSSLNPWAINYSEHDPISKANKFFYHLTRDRESNHNIRNLRSILLIRTEFKNLKRRSKSNRVKEQFCLQRPSISNKSSTNPNLIRNHGVVVVEDPRGLKFWSRVRSNFPWHTRAHNSRRNEENRTFGTQWNLSWEWCRAMQQSLVWRHPFLLISAINVHVLSMSVRLPMENGKTRLASEKFYPRDLFDTTGRKINWKPD